jgi:acetyl-CoA acetyltransferase
LVDRTKVPFEDVGHIVCGQVVQECKTSNIAREAAITAGFPDSIPCNTVTLACISSAVSTQNIASMISTGYLKAGIAGGVELLSDFPVRYNRKVINNICKYIYLQNHYSLGTFVDDRFPKSKESGRQSQIWLSNA